MNQKKSALLVIDLQVAPLYGTHNKEKVLDIIKELIARAEENQVPIFYVQHEEEAGGFLERGTPFWQLVEGISPRLFDTTIYKKKHGCIF